MREMTQCVRVGYCKHRINTTHSYRCSIPEIHCWDRVPIKEKTEMKIDDKGGIILGDILAVQGTQCMEFEHMIGKLVIWGHENSTDTGPRLRYETYKPFLDANPRALDWLLQKGLVEKVEEKTYYIGQRFRRIDGIFTIVRSGKNTAGLLQYNRDNFWSWDVAIKDASTITQHEFDTMQGEHKGEFTEVAE